MNSRGSSLMSAFPRPSNMLLLIALAVLVTGCGSARRGEPLVGPLPLASEEAKQGQNVFMRNCHQCHPGGEAGLGPALNNKPLPRFMMRYQVRHGLGAMPAFSEQQIDDDELDHLLVYLKKLREHG